MTIKCMIDRKKYNNKPQGGEIGRIQNSLSQTKISIEKLADSLISGQTFKPALLNGRGDDSWVQQQLFALDFDENTTIEEELNRCDELNIKPVFGYTSFSHTDSQHKFRLVFCNETIIYNRKEAKAFQLLLMGLFKHCDVKCKNVSRLFYGGRFLIFEGYNNRINHKDIAVKYSDSNALEIIPHDNKNIVNNTHSILGDNSNNPSKYYNIKAFRDRNVEYLKGKINNPKIILENSQAFFDYIKSYDLGTLLEIKYPHSFKCIFHKDNNPSAGIFINENGDNIYNCFGCGVSYNIINIVELLGNFKSRPKAYKFIREIFNLEIMETEWQKEQKELLKENRRMLYNGELEKNCPTAYKNIKRNIKYLEQLLLIAEDNVYSEKLTDDDNNVVFFAGTKYICNQMGLKESSAKEVSKKSVLLAYHKMVNKLDDAQIPETMLKKTLAKKIDKGKNYKRLNYYSIPSYTTSLFKDMEYQGVEWKANNYNMQGCTREMFFRTEGKEVADWLYPQYKEIVKGGKVVDRKVSNKSQKMTNDIHKVVMDLLEIKSYVVEKEVVQILKVKYGKTKTEVQIKKSLQEMLDIYGLQRIRCNKVVKGKYNVEQKGYPFIIIKGGLI